MPAVEAHEVSASWRRSALEHRVDPESDAAPYVATESEIRRAAERLGDLLASAQEEVDRLHAVVRQVGYVVLLCDTRGIAVHHRGDESLAECFRDRGTWAGGMWAEELEGTNGVGTAIAEERPISVHRDQHFRRRHAGLSCAAAPIFDPGGELVAALDSSAIASEAADHSHGLALAATITAARAIEERLFRERYRGSWIIAAAPADDSGSAVLIAVDADRFIIGADRMARSVLGFSESRLKQGVHLSVAFDGVPSLPARGPVDGRDLAVLLERAADATRWQALITPPESRSKRWARSGESHAHSRPRVGALTRPQAAAPVAPLRGGLPPGLARRIREYIETHLDEAISLEALASRAGQSVHHFARAFKQTVGIPPYEYLLRKRVDRARQLLGDTDLTLSEIALSVGFSDHSHFARHFRRLTGLTPSAARRSQR